MDQDVKGVTPQAFKKFLTDDKKILFKHSTGGCNFFYKIKFANNDDDSDEE